MLKRFFVIMNRNWTFEMEYCLEILRLVFVNIVTICSMGLFIRATFLPTWLRIITYVVVPVYWFFYSRYSLGRMVQIHNNRKFARFFKANDIVKIMRMYPNQPLYVKINNKYRKILNCENLDDKDIILLITIGKKSISEYKSIKNI